MDGVLLIADVVGVMTRALSVFDGSLASWARCCRATRRVCVALMAHRTALLRFSPIVSDLSASAAIAAEAYRCYLLALACGPAAAGDDAGPRAVAYDAVVVSAADDHGRVGNPRLVRVASGDHGFTRNGDRPVVLSLSYLLRRPSASEPPSAMYGGNTLAERVLRSIPLANATLRDAHALCCAFWFDDDASLASSGFGVNVRMVLEVDVGAAGDIADAPSYRWSVDIAASRDGVPAILRCIRTAIVAEAAANAWSSVALSRFRFLPHAGSSSPAQDDHGDDHAALLSRMCDALRDFGRRRAQFDDDGADQPTTAGEFARRLAKRHDKLAALFGADAWRRATSPLSERCNRGDV